jgi:hypothetical protein
MTLPSLRNVNIAKKMYEKLKGWKLANRVTSSYFPTHPNNIEKETVIIKVVLVDRLYFTNIKEPLRMANHILKLEVLDEQLKRNEIKAVDCIANFGQRKVISFGSKYAHFYNKAAFPVYDQYVSKAIATFRGKGFSHAWL